MFYKVFGIQGPVLDGSAGGSPTRGPEEVKIDPFWTLFVEQFLGLILESFWLSFAVLARCLRSFGFPLRCWPGGGLAS